MFIFISLFVVCVILFLFSETYIRICKKFHIYDVSNIRSSHKGKVITGGGIIIFLSILAYYLFFCRFYFFIGFLLICCLGFFDDLKIIVNSKKKLLYQLLISLTILYEFNHSPLLLLLLFVPIVFLVTLNVYNFMDGINGMIGLFTFFLIPIFYAFNIKFKFIDENFLYFMMVGLIVFGYYNFRRKAILFAGDTGSLCLGFLVSFIIIKLFFVTNSILCFSLVIVFYADAIFTIIHRLIKKENIFIAHRMHIYERLVDYTRLNHLSVSLIYCLFQFFLNFFIFINFDALIRLEIKFYFIIFTILLIIYISILYYLENLRLNGEKHD